MTAITRTRTESKKQANSWIGRLEMTKISSERLSKGDLRFLMNLLDKAEEESNTEIEIDGDNKSEATAALKRIRRIRLALIDLDKH